MLKNKEGKYVTPKVEIKNINSFSHVVEAINYEVKRQTEALDLGIEELVQETRRYDESTNTTIRMRTKVDSVDYKYFVEPNIPRIKIETSYLEEIKKEIPVLPNVRLIKYIKEYGFTEGEAKTIVRDIDLSNYFEELVSLGVAPKTAFNWISSQIIGYLNKEYMNIKDFYLTPRLLKEIIDAINDGIISSKQGKELFYLCLDEKQEPSVLIKTHNMSQMSDDGTLSDIIDKIIENNPEQRKAFHNGRNNLFDYFVGQVMKETRGKANPVKVKEILNERL